MRPKSALSNRRKRLGASIVYLLLGFFHQSKRGTHGVVGVLKTVEPHSVLKHLLRLAAEHDRHRNIRLNL